MGVSSGTIRRTICRRSIPSYGPRIGGRLDYCVRTSSVVEEITLNYGPVRNPTGIQIIWPPDSNPAERARNTACTLRPNWHLRIWETVRLNLDKMLANASASRASKLQYAGLCTVAYLMDQSIWKHSLIQNSLYLTRLSI